MTMIDQLIKKAKTVAKEMGANLSDQNATILTLITLRTMALECGMKIDAAIISGIIERQVRILKETS